jgi:hypothetical protein
MQMHAIKNKIKDILESYLLYIGYKMAFIKDDELTEQIEHRKEMCSDCVLNRFGWCSKRRKTLTIIDGLHTLVRGCSCYLPAKYFSVFKIDSCPLNKWEK